MMAIKILRTVGATKMADAVDRWMRGWTLPPTWSPLIARQSRNLVAQHSSRRARVRLGSARDGSSFV